MNGVVRTLFAAAQAEAEPRRMRRYFGARTTEPP